MGSFRFRRTVKVAPGVRLNLNKRSIGLSAGTRGSRVSIDSDGRSTRSVGIPGTGLYYRSQTGAKRSAKGRPRLAAIEGTTSASPSRLLRHLVGWLCVLIALLLAFSGHASAAGGVLAVGLIAWFVLRLLGGVIDVATTFALRWRSSTVAAFPRSPAVSTAPIASAEDDYELAEANVPIGWRESNAWRSWEPPRDFVAGESHYLPALWELAGKPRAHGYLLPVDVVFLREPENAFDANAWRALVDGRHIGYFARQIAAQLSPVLDPLRITTFSLCGVIRGGSLEAPNLGVHVWPGRRPAAGPALQQLDDALAVSWPPNIDEGADTAAVDQFNVQLRRARDILEAGGPDSQIYEYLKAAAEIAIANDNHDQREAAAAVAERLIRYAKGTQTLGRATRIKKRLEPKTSTTRRTGTETEDRLSRLKGLLDRNVISAEEYEAQRASIIKQL